MAGKKSKEEQALLESIENGEWRSIPNLEQEKKRYRYIAQEQIKNKLTLLRSLLSKARLDRNDSQKEFAARIGVFIPTLAKMEKGAPTVPIGTWVRALDILDHLDDLDSVLLLRENLFEQNDRLSVKKIRQRASEKK